MSSLQAHPVAQAPRPPTGWLVGPPDYVGVGAARSGTSWWHGLIAAHPGVARAPGIPCDLHYFDDRWQAGLDEAGGAAYEAWFPRPAGMLAGEWTPSYMFDAWVPPLLRRAAPQARLLVLLRDPVARFRSGRRGNEDRSRSGTTARAAANASFSRGLYADQLLRLWSAFPREQVLVLQYERCLRDARAELRRTYAFLGLDPTLADEIDLGAGESSSHRQEAGWLDERQEAILARTYADENERLARLLPDIDLDLWARSGAPPDRRS